MKHTEFTIALKELGLSQADFSKMSGLTTRTINLWATGERSVSPSAVAYLKLLSKIPKSLFEAERAAKLGVQTMRTGMYSIQFGGKGGSGVGALVFTNGQLYGVDEAGAKYDGNYSQSEQPGYVNLSITVSVPAGVELVQGVPAQKSRFSFNIENNIPVNDEISFNQPTMFGSVNVILKHMRDLPN